MQNLIIILVLAAIIGYAVGYIYKSKKRGHKCIGCPEGTCTCSCQAGGCSGCGGSCNER